ncbi:MAG: hypothetical protein EA396_08200 [Anaerolineaceae bacterium]|nr:MAG: hypothetical protein EA396_08200 [Anaerolineaceae bacterium]
MAFTNVQREAVRKLIYDVPDIDRRLPIWARRTNPIVLRELGPYWRVFPPELSPVLRWLAAHAALLILSVFSSLVFIPIIIAMIVGVGMLPFMVYYYGGVLLRLIHDAAGSMAREYENSTIDVLRATPYSTREIVLSKITAAVWRRMDMVLIATSFTVTVGMTVIVVIYLNAYPPETHGILPQVLSFLALLTSLIRVPLEMFMAAALAVLLGAASRSKQIAFLSTAGLLFFYFLLTNMLSLLSVGLAVRVFIDVILPLAAPALIAYFCVRRTIHLLYAR